MKNYKITTTPTSKVSITITREQLWYNYVDQWKEITLCDKGACGISDLATVHSVLCADDYLYVEKLERLFKEGCTMFLMGEAFQHIDDGQDKLLEIVVLDKYGYNDESKFRAIVIPHHSIKY
jgi:hypothetical protein